MTMDEKTKLEVYRRELIDRLNACTFKPQHTIEYWLTEDDISFLASINVKLDA
jgi:hypothetical protein